VRRLALVALVLAARAANVSADGSDDPAARAKELYSEGKRYYDVADYDHAIDAWKQAYVTSSAPMLLYNIGQAYRLKGDCASAMRFYATYEREAGADLDKASLDEARARCNPQPTGANPPPTFPVSPQPPPASALHDVGLDHDVAQPSPPRDDHSAMKTAGIATAAAGAVLIGVGVYLEHVASDDASKVQSYRGVWTQTQRDWESSGQAASTWGAISTAAGAAAVVGGVVLYYVGMKSDRVDVVATPHALGLSWAGSF
jgi:tetratricopeptide (TPR) repeat protein